MTGFDLSTIQNCYIGGTAASAIYYGSTKIWPTAYDYAQDYFTIESLADNNDIIIGDYQSGLSYNIYYSLDEGQTWITYIPLRSSTSIRLNNGQRMLIKSTVNRIYYGIESTYEFNVYGNLHSLLYGDDFKNMNSLPSNFKEPRLFIQSKVVDASNLVLPATILRAECYEEMFGACSKLIHPPKLPATTLAEYCYYHMFWRCSSLTVAPQLPATTLAEYCYLQMFEECTSLITAPELPATTMAENCYASMFYGCTSLVTAPELPATTLARGCYASMFYDCTSLVTAPELPATTPASACYNYMFHSCSSLNSIVCLLNSWDNYNYTEAWTIGVAASGNFYKNPNATDWGYYGNGIPYGWNVYNASM